MWEPVAKKCDRSAARLGDERERLARREDADGAKRIEGPQILIAGDDEAGVGGERTGEHLIVVGIATDWGISAVRTSCARAR